LSRVGLDEIRGLRREHASMEPRAASVAGFTHAERGGSGGSGGCAASTPQLNQNRKRTPNWISRGGSLVSAIRPNAAVPKVTPELETPGFANWALLNTLKASTRNSRVLLPIEVFLKRDRSV